MKDFEITHKCKKSINYLLKCLAEISATMTYCTTRILSIYWVFLQYICSIYSVFPEKSIFQQHFQIRVIYILCIYFWTGKKNRLKWEIHLYTWYILDIQLLKKMYFDRFRKEINQFWKASKNVFCKVNWMGDLSSDEQIEFLK